MGSDPTPDAGKEGESAAKVALREQARHALPLFKQLAREFDALPRSATLGQWSQAISQFAQSIGLLKAANSEVVPEARRDGEAWQRLLDALAEQHRLSDWLDEEPRRLDRSEFVDYMRELVRGERLSDTDDETGCVRVLAAESARNLTAAYVFVAGLSEASFPLAYREDCIHSEAETRELAAAGLPVVPHRDRRSYEMLLFYEAVTRATRRLVLSYPALDAAALPLPPSPYVSEVEYAFAPLRLQSSAPQDLSGVPTSDEVVSPREFRVRAVDRALAGEPALLAELCAHPLMAPAADNILAGLRTCDARRAKGFGPFEGILSSPAAHAALAARYGDDHCWSPSQLERYARCPFQFLLASVLRIEPLDDLEIEIDYLARGRLLHEVLLAAHRELNERLGGPRSPSEESEEEFSAAVVRHLRERVRELAGDRALANGMLEIDARRVASWLADYHRQHGEYDRQFRAPPRPAHFEVAFGPRRRYDDEGDQPQWKDALSTDEPFELQCGDKRILFSGQIDRIDVGQIGQQQVFNIVDYKSGRPSSATSAQAVIEGNSLQLPLYALAAEQLLASSQAVPLHAAYWHVAADGYREAEAIKFHYDAEGRLARSPEWKDLENQLQARVRALVARIQHGKFPMLSVEEKCTSFCAFRTVCRVNQVRHLEKTWQDMPEDSQ